MPVECLCVCVSVLCVSYRWPNHLLEDTCRRSLQLGGVWLGWRLHTYRHSHFRLVSDSTEYTGRESMVLLLCILWSLVCTYAAAQYAPAAICCHFKSCFPLTHIYRDNEEMVYNFMLETGPSLKWASAPVFYWVLCWVCALRMLSNCLQGSLDTGWKVQGWMHWIGRHEWWWYVNHPSKFFSVETTYDEPTFSLCHSAEPQDFRGFYATSRYWRLVIADNYGGHTTCLAEVQFFGVGKACMWLCSSLEHVSIKLTMRAVE